MFPLPLPSLVPAPVTGSSDTGGIVALSGVPVTVGVNGTDVFGIVGATVPVGTVVPSSCVTVIYTVAVKKLGANAARGPFWSSSSQRT